MVVGAGPTGLAAALGLARKGHFVTLFAPEGAPRDTRTAALLGPSVDLLDDLGVGATCRDQAAPLRAIRIIDASRRLVRAPEVEFLASEVGRESFGYNIPNLALTDALTAQIRETPRIEVVRTAGVAQIEPSDDTVVATIEEGACYSASLAVGADGRRSICRRSAGIAVAERRFDQAAIACAFSHGEDHRDVSTELHREAGPLTVIPLPGGRRSSVVWVGETTEVTRLMALDDTAFGAALERQLRGLLGRIHAVELRTSFPLGTLKAKRSAQHRIALVGEAAHVMPPIGAQGLNLGFRDVAALIRCVSEARDAGRDIGGDETLSNYAAARSRDVAQRMFAVDLLNSSLIAPLLPVQAARGLALAALGSVPPLRRMAMRFGLGAQSA